MAKKLPAAAGLPPVLVYAGDRPWRPAGLRQLTAPVPAGLRRWQPDLEMLLLDAATLTAEDAEINPAAALLANEEDVERLAQVGDLVVGCASAEELLRRGRGLLDGGS